MMSGILWLPKMSSKRWSLFWHFSGHREILQAQQWSVYSNGARGQGGKYLLWGIPVRNPYALEFFLDVGCFHIAQQSGAHDDQGKAQHSCSGRLWCNDFSFGAPALHHLDAFQDGDQVTGGRQGHFLRVSSCFSFNQQCLMPRRTENSQRADTFAASRYLRGVRRSFFVLPIWSLRRILLSWSHVYQPPAIVPWCASLTPPAPHQSQRRHYQICAASHTFFPKATAKGSFEKSTTIKDCRSDGCLERLSSKTAEVITVFKDCHQRLLFMWQSSITAFTSAI